MWEVLGLIGGLLVAVALMLMIVATRYGTTKYLFPAIVSCLLGMMFVFAYAIQWGLWPVWIPTIVQVAAVVPLALQLSEAARRARLARSPPGVEAVMWNMAARMDDKDMIPPDGPLDGASPTSSDKYKDSVCLLPTTAPAPGMAAPSPPVSSLRGMFVEDAKISAQASQHLNPTPDSKKEPPPLIRPPDARKHTDNAVVVATETTTAHNNAIAVLNPLGVLDAPLSNGAPPSLSSVGGIVSPPTIVDTAPHQSPEPSLDLAVEPPGGSPAELHATPPTELLPAQPIELPTELHTELPADLPEGPLDELPSGQPVRPVNEPPMELPMHLASEPPTDMQAHHVSPPNLQLGGLSTIKSNPKWLQDMQKSRADLQSMLQRVSGLLQETESSLYVHSRSGATSLPSRDNPHGPASQLATPPTCTAPPPSATADLRRQEGPTVDAAPLPDPDAFLPSTLLPTLPGRDPATHTASPHSLPETPPSCAERALPLHPRAAAVLDPEPVSHGSLPPRPAPALAMLSASPLPQLRPVLPPLPLGSEVPRTAETTPRDQMLASNRSTDEFFTPLATLRQARTPREVTPRLLGPLLSDAGGLTEVPEAALVAWDAAAAATAAEAADIATDALSEPKSSVPASPAALIAGCIEPGALSIQEEEFVHQAVDGVVAWAPAVELVDREPPQSKEDDVKMTTETSWNLETEANPCLDMGILTPPEMSGSSGGASEARRDAVVTEQAPVRLAEASAADVPGWSVASSTPRNTSRTGASSPRSLGPSPLRSVRSCQGSSDFPEEVTAARPSPASPQDWTRVSASPESQSTFGTQQSAVAAPQAGAAFQMPRLPLAEIPSGALCGHLYNHQVSVRSRQAAVLPGNGTQRSFAAATQRSSQLTGITLDDSDVQPTRRSGQEGTGVGTPEAKSWGRPCPSERSATSAPWLGHGCESMAGSSLMYPSEQDSPGESIPQESERLRVEAILALKQISPQCAEVNEANPQPTDRCAQPSVSGRTNYLLEKLFSGINMRWDSKESEVCLEGADVESTSLARKPMPEAPLDSYAISVSHNEPDARATPSSSEPEVSGMTSNFAPSVDSYMNTPNLHMPALAAVPGQPSSPGDDACTSALTQGRVQSVGRRRTAPGGSGAESAATLSGPPIVRGWKAVNRHNSAGAGRLRKGKMSDISPTISRDAMQRALGKVPGADVLRPHHPPPPRWRRRTSGTRPTSTTSHARRARRSCTCPSPAPFQSEMARSRSQREWLDELGSEARKTDLQHNTSVALRLFEHTG